MSKQAGQKKKAKSKAKQAANVVEIAAKRKKQGQSEPAPAGISPAMPSYRATEMRNLALPPLGPPPPLLRQTKATAAALALLEKGIEYIHKRDFKKARAELQTLIQSYPGEAEIVERARTYIRICDREEAAPRKQPTSTDQLYALGILEHNRGNYDEAISYFRRSLEKHPDADYIYYSVAASLARKGDVTGSLENLKKAIELNQDSRIFAKNDADFAALQSEKEFAELVGLSPAPATKSR